MRLSAILVALCVHGVYLDLGASAAETTTGRAQPARVAIIDGTVTIAAASPPAVVFEAGMSVDEYNRLIDERDPNAYRMVSVQVPHSLVSAAGLLDRKTSFQSGGETFRGHVHSFRMQGGGQSHSVIEVSVRIENQRQGDAWLLAAGARGRLVIH